MVPPFLVPPSRGHYFCSVYGARLMVPAGRGLIVIISSTGGLQYLFNVPYGVGKAAVRTQWHGGGEGIGPGSTHSSGGKSPVVEWRGQPAITSPSAPPWTLPSPGRLSAGQRRQCTGERGWLRRCLEGQGTGTSSEEAGRAGEEDDMARCPGSRSTFCPSPVRQVGC